MSAVFSEIKESLTMRQVAEHFGFSVNRAGFIHSPWGKDKTASCKLYPHSFYDFSSGTGGDLIKFAAAVLGVNNWQACQYLIEAFNLPFSLSGSADNREQIKQRERERRQQQEHEQNFREAWQEEVDSLKRWESVYCAAIHKRIFPPFSEMQAFTVAELQKISYALDMLCIYGNRQEQEDILTDRGWKL